MKSLRRLFFVAVVFTSVISSCKKDAAPKPDLGYNYFPGQVGRYIVYNVDSTYYDDFADSSRNYKFQLKEKIQSVFSDNQNRPAIRLERYVKYYNPSIPYSNMQWQLRNVWVENITATTAEKVEENIRYMKLAFPVKENQNWNGNAQNTNDPWNYSYAFYDLPRTLGGIHFDSVLQVNQHNELSLIDQVYYEEKYARNVGLVYKRVIDIGSQPPDYTSQPYANDSLAAFFAIPILQRADSGVNYTWTVTAYGIE